MQVHSMFNVGDETVEIRCRSLDGMIYGRLAIFDALPDQDDEDKDAKETNPNMHSYVKTYMYSLVDRFFLSNAVRHVFICHRPSHGKRCWSRT